MKPSNLHCSCCKFWDQAPAQALAAYWNPIGAVEKMLVLRKIVHLAIWEA